MRKYRDQTQEIESINIDGREKNYNDDAENVRRSRKRKRKNSKKRKRSKNYLKRILFFMVIMFCLWAVLSSDIFAVDKIQVEGINYYTKEEILELGQMKTGENIFSIKNNEGLEAIENLLYVKDVEIKKNLPNEITINVTEREPIAVVQGEKKYYLIDAEKIVLEVLDAGDEETKIEKVKVEEGKVGEEIKVDDREILEESLKIAYEAHKNGTKLYGIQLDYDEKNKNYIGNIYIYANLVCKGDVEDILRVISEGYLEEIVKTLDERNIKRGTLTVTKSNEINFSLEMK